MQVAADNGFELGVLRELGARSREQVDHARVDPELARVGALQDAAQERARRARAVAFEGRGAQRVARGLGACGGGAGAAQAPPTFRRRLR